MNLSYSMACVLLFFIPWCNNCNQFSESFFKKQLFFYKKNIKDCNFMWLNNILNKFYYSGWKV